MKVYLIKDVPQVGLAGEIVKVKEGYFNNYLSPRKLALEVNKKNEQHFKNRERIVEHRKEVLESETSMLAEKIKSLKLTLKKKTHDDGKLYGSIRADEVVELLKNKGINISKSQVEFGKSIKSTGEFPVTIKLSSKLQPQFTVAIVSL